MLVELTIREFAIVDEARISFGRGFHVLTGETGAGKSIILDALGLVLGWRASGDMVRRTAERASVEALFDLADAAPAVIEMLGEQGIELDDDHTVIISRDVNTAGRSTARVNGKMVTAQFLRTLGQRLLHLHGQHEAQALLDDREHLRILDTYGHTIIGPCLARMSEAFAAYQQVRNELRAAKEQEKNRLMRMDIVKMQLEELRAARLKPGEEEELEREERRLANAERLFAAADAYHQTVYAGNDRRPSVLEALHGAVAELETLVRYDDEVSEWVELTRSSLYQLEDVALQVRDYRDRFSFNPDRLAAVSDRLAVIERLTRKYGESVEQLCARRDQLAEEWDQLSRMEDYLAEIRSRLDSAREVVRTAAMTLSEARLTAQTDLERAIGEQLAALSMPKTRFVVSMTRVPDEQGILVSGEKIRITESGMDKVEFLFSANTGEPPRPLSRVASGGELSRTMLALTTITADADQVPTVIFDEVDTGISGRAAQAVAERLAMLGRGRQVIVVTHLPQVACMADHHFLITKLDDADRTLTQVVRLPDPERVEELARMLSGAELTDTTREHAREMLAMAQHAKAG